MKYGLPTLLTGYASTSLTRPEATSSWPTATSSSMVSGASGTSAVFRNSTMLFMVKGMPYSWPL
ncbi:hypothetical protein MVA48_14280 [Blastococcus sp. PRF04-17]|nr:hypothetical protein [Blastococcus sp. PRF04-17]UOY00174.1 hypothetical protein MVA48_14280 [Blastococcus sp. PRF04-17]